MVNRIVVHTPTKEDWNEVQKFLWEVLYKDISVEEDYPDEYFTYGKDSCITLAYHGGYYGDRTYYIANGYTVISMEEFREQYYKKKENADANPKQALGLANIPMNLLSPITCAYGSIGKLNGQLKYGLSNYLGTQVIMSIYMDAIRRHIDGIMSGEEYDPADGVPHWSAILANVDIILCARAAGTLIDDRPLLKGYREEMDKLKPIVNSLKELHKDKNPKHYYLNEENNNA